MLYSDLRTRWSQILHFPEEIVSEDHLLILVGRKHIYKPGFNIIHFVRMCHYLLIDKYRVFAILNISCSKCYQMLLGTVSLKQLQFGLLVVNWWFY